MGKIIGIIPARWGSTRFPGKALEPIAGKPLIQHVWQRCLAASKLDGVIVATDDMRIAEAAFGFGAEVAMTSSRHPSGTDRIAQVAARLGRGVSHVINIQGDEPTIAPALDRPTGLGAQARPHPADGHGGESPARPGADPGARTA